MMQPGIILLKDGTDDSQGIPQIISNINACQALSDSVKTTLGPYGMDKLICTNGSNTITNDGATVLKLMDIVHPAAKILVDISKAQDQEVGDGTTSVALLAVELLKNAKPFIEEGIHSRIIARSFQKSCEMAIEELTRLKVDIDVNNTEKSKEKLVKCAQTAMNSKLICEYKNMFSEMIVDSVLHIDNFANKSIIGMKQVPGGSMQDTMLIFGVAFKKTFSYAGFEMQPKKYLNPKICLLNIELELKAEKDNAEIRVSNVQEYQKIVDCEWAILYEKLDKISQSGAKIVLSKLPIGDVATQYFADRDIFCAGRVAEDDLKRTLKACGGSVLTTVNDVKHNDLGSCEIFEEIQIGSERYNIIKDGKNTKSCTFILRGGGEQFLAEMERSFNDAISIVRRMMKNSSVVAGGGAIEMTLSKYLRDQAFSNEGIEQMLMLAFAKSLEIIPLQLCQNAGLDPTNIINKLRFKHTKPDGIWYGVDLNNNDISDNLVSFIWEPCVMKRNVIQSATEAASLILTIDETVKNPSRQQNS